MRREERIRRYLESHPRVSPDRLREKFGLSVEEERRLFPAAARSEDRVSRFRPPVFLKRLFAPRRNRLAALAALAAVVRIGYAFALFRHEELGLPILDAEYYLLWAKDIVDNGWLGDGVFFTEPFYAYFLAVPLRLFGESATAAIVPVVQWIFGLTFPVVVYLLSERLFGKFAAGISGALAALFGPFVFYEGLLLKTGLEVWSLAVFVLFLLRVSGRPTRNGYAVLGLLLGVIVLVKGNNIVFWPLLAATVFVIHAAFPIRERIVLGALFSIGVILPIAPIAMRNFSVGHDLVPTNYSIGLVFYQGNWYGSDGSTALAPPFLRPHPKYEEADAVGMAEAFVGRPLKPSEVSRFWIGKAFREMAGDPIRAVRTVIDKFLLIVNRGEVSDNYSYGYYASRIPILRILFPAWPIIALGVAGCVAFAFFRPSSGSAFADAEEYRRARFLLSVVMLGYLSVLLATNVNSRYRMPLFPFLLAFSGYAVAFFRDAFSGRIRRGLVPVLLVLSGALLTASLPLPSVVAVGEANALHTIGDGYLNRGDDERAERYFEAAKEADPGHAWAYKNLFWLALSRGDRERAYGNLKGVIMIRPDDLSNFDLLRSFKESPGLADGELPDYVRRERERMEDRRYDPWSYEAGRYGELGDADRSEKEYLRSLANLGEDEGVLLRLAAIAKEKGDTAEAKRRYRRSIELNPWLLPARYNLANIAIGENDYGQVASLLALIYETVPELGETWYNYAVALVKTGRNQEALAVGSAFIERYGNDPARSDKVRTVRAMLVSGQTGTLPDRPQ